jgi:hypothetical protein
MYRYTGVHVLYTYHMGELKSTDKNKECKIVNNMSCYVRSATVTPEGIVIYYDEYKPGAITANVCTFYTETVGNWYSLVFEPEQLRLYKFMDTMMVPTVDSLRLQAMSLLDEIMAYEQDIDKKVHIMNAVTILDKTFTPPHINTRCGWQKDLVDAIICSYIRYVIQTCKNVHNLKRFFTYVRTL